ncbi:MAG: glycoside hydrolase family 15 protein [Calditrichaeota bacterium]|nr:glycoside hydrolase family 15 protein [Calditrichota bacterium]
MEFTVNARVICTKWVFVLVLLLVSIGQASGMLPGGKNVQAHRSFFRLPVSNGWVAATVNVRSQSIDGFWPHIYRAIDETHPVKNLIKNLSFQISINGQKVLLSDCKFKEARYLTGTGIIRANYVWKSWPIELTVFSPMSRRGASFVVIVQVVSPEKNSQKDLQITCVPARLPTIHISESSEWTRQRLFQKMFIFSVQKRSSDFLRWARKKTPQDVLHSEMMWWKTWQKQSRIPKNLTQSQRHLFLQSLVVLKMAQCREEGLAKGQILASLPPGMWNIAWVRDGAYSIVALARSGHFKEARMGLQFMLRAKSGFYEHFIWKGKDYGVGMPYQISVCRYFGSGKEESDFNENGPNIELDGFGLFLWAMDEYVSRSKDVAFLRENWKEILEKVAEPLLRSRDSLGVIRAESGPWERHLPGAHFAYTTASAINGFRAVSHLAGLLNDEPHHQFYANVSADLTQHFSRVFLDSTRHILKGRLEGSFPGTLDASAIEAFNWAVFPPDSPLSRKTLAVYRKNLHIKNRSFGFCRLLSPDWYDRQEWVFVDFRMAKALRAVGQTKDSQQIVAWIEDQAAKNFDLIAELFEEKTADYKGAVPMAGYGAGAYILNFLE